MTRPRKTDAPDPKRAIELTVGAIERLQPPATGQIFLRDTRQPGLKVRCTAAGAKSYVHEGKLAGQTLRITIGDVRTWELQAARAEARRLACLIDQNRDPRELARQEAAAREAAARAAKLAQTSARDAWNAYVSERRPRWSEAHARDHERKAAPGGEPIRGGGVTQPGPLCALLSLPLRELDSERITRWAQAEAQRRPTSARLSLRLLHSFLNWARECPEYRDLVPAGNPAGARRAREALGRPQAKNDVLLRAQLPAFAQAVDGLLNPLHQALFWVLLLTGGRLREILGLRWASVDTRWNLLHIAGKTGPRTLPLTRFTKHTLAGLPRRGEFVFADASGEGHIAPPYHALERVCGVAGVAVTFHGLRRAFASLAEQTDMPAGAAMQVMGHTPSGVREKHYVRRDTELLRRHLQHYEDEVLSWAGVTFTPPDDE